MGDLKYIKVEPSMDGSWDGLVRTFSDRLVRVYDSRRGETIEGRLRVRKNDSGYDTIKKYQIVCDSEIVTLDYDDIRMFEINNVVEACDRVTEELDLEELSF